MVLVVLGTGKEAAAACVVGQARYQVFSGFCRGVGLDWIPFSKVERWSGVRCDNLDGGCAEKAQWACH